MLCTLRLQCAGLRPCHTPVCVQERLPADHDPVCCGAGAVDSAQLLDDALACAPSGTGQLAAHSCRILAPQMLVNPCKLNMQGSRSLKRQCMLERILK